MSAQDINAKIKHRVDTSANWTSVNPVLLAGEMGVESDTTKFKFGDGTTTWNSLSYSVSGGIQSETGLETRVFSDSDWAFADGLYTITTNKLAAQVCTAVYRNLESTKEMVLSGIETTDTTVKLTSLDAFSGAFYLVSYVVSLSLLGVQVYNEELGIYERLTAADIGGTSEVYTKAETNELVAIGVANAISANELAGRVTMFSGTFGGSDGKRPLDKNTGLADEGWAYCDGTNGTPNLKDRFIVSTGDSYGLGNTGGETYHTLSWNEMPVHSHPQNVTANSGGTGVRRDYQADVAGLYSYPQGINTDNAGAGYAHENRPPYYALAFIMKL